MANGHHYNHYDHDVRDSDGGDGGDGIDGGDGGDGMIVHSQNSRQVTATTRFFLTVLPVPGET